MAVARDAGVDPHRHIVAVIGDGSMTGGMAYEALNNLGHSRRRVIIVLNDNGRSYAPTVSNLVAPTGRAATSRPDHPSLLSRDRRASCRTRSPTSASTRRTCAASARSRSSCATCPSSARRPSGPSRRSRPAVREFLQPPSFFEALGVRYVGPSTATTSRSSSTRCATPIELSADGPIVVHVLTQKGRGYPPAEDDDEKHLHDAPVFDPLIGPPKAVPTGYTQAFAEAIIKEAEADPRVVAITAAMAGPTGLLPFQDRFPDRFFDVGIAEQHAVTGAAGMAMGGLRPVVAIYSTFLNRAWDQVVYDVALHRLPVVFCLDRAGITGPDGAEPPRRVRHGAARPACPGMRVLAPSSAQELHQMLHDAMTLADGGPVAIRYPRGAGPPGRRARGRRRHPRPRGSAAPTSRRRARCACWPSASWSRPPRRPPTHSPPRASTSRVWDVRCCAPLDAGDARRRRRATAPSSRARTASATAASG